MCYFASGKFDAPAAMFTASHNPAQYNGIKLCRAGAAPVVKSTFKNATGLPQEGHLTTARELGSLARYLIEVFPEYFSIYSEREFTWNDITQQNRNPLLGAYPGADGLKTGYTSESGYGLIGTAVRSGRRLILVINGLSSTGQRSAEAQKLLDWGFRQFRSVELFAAGQAVGAARVWGGTQSFVPLAARENIDFMLSDDERAGAEAEVVYSGPLRAPIKSGVEVGVLRFKINGKIVSQVPLFTAADVGASDQMWRKALDSVLYYAFGG
jgi:D-alanyl-D-alanine carboxypeptidase (penicillin-binding protein 5/6)